MDIYEEALKIAEELGIVEECWNGANGSEPEAFCWSLGGWMFVENEEHDPSTELVSDRLTPEMIDWYDRQLREHAS